MSQVQICPRGHRWDNHEVSQHAVQVLCPHCGAEGNMLFDRDTLPATEHDSSPLLNQPAATPVVQGYEILEEVGRGGMGVIYRAHHLASGRIVALKMISAGAHASSVDFARFRAEIEAIRRVRHPNIVEVVQIGEQNGLPFVALEFMDRGSLAQCLGNAPLPPRYAAELMELLCRAMQSAHESGILHRDIKPANVLLASPSAQTDVATLPGAVRLLGVPKLTDFGLAKRIGDGPCITRTGAVLGTPAYMAPELAEGQSAKATTAVDVYSLGAVLYEALTGKPPYDGSTALETLDKVRRSEPPAPDRLVPDLPAPLVNICLGAMARDPARRYASPRAMADDLRRFLDGLPVTARREPLLHRATRWIRRHPAITALSAAMVLVVGLCLMLLITTWRMASGNSVSSDDPSVEYYGGVIRRWGVPEGVYRLSPEQVKRREVSFRIQRRGTCVEKVEAVDRTGRATNRHSFIAYLERGDSDQPFRRECRWEYSFEGGELTRETAFDRVGQVVWSFRYTTKTTGHYTDKRGFPRARAGSGAAYVSFVYSDDGLVKELRYLNPSGKPRPDRHGIFGQCHEHDARGFVIGIGFLGAEDQPVVHPDGYAREVRRYDERGNRMETAYFGLDALPVLGPSGLARKMTSHDADGNPTEIRAFGIDGALTRRTEGYASERRTYDSSGRLIRIEHRDANGQPARDWFGVARHEFAYAEGGLRVTEAFLDREGKPVKHRLLGCTKLTSIYADDDDSQPTELIAFDYDPAFRRDGRFSLAAPHVKRKLDQSGHVVEESYFDRDGSPMLSWYGVHRVRIAYTERGQRSEIRFEGFDGKPIAPLIKSVGGDDPNRRPNGDVPSGRGPARIVWKWDEQGNNVEARAFTVDNQPDDSWTLPMLYPLGGREGEFPLPPGVARVGCKFDERGNIIEAAHFDRDGQLLPAVKTARNATVRGRLVLSYDEHGNLSEAALFGPDGRLASGIGVCRLTAQHDEDGRPLGYTLFGPEGRMPGPAGISRYRFAYDRQGNRTTETYYDPDDRPMAGPSGYAEARFYYDLRGNLTESKFFDPTGQPLMTRVVVERVSGEGPAIDLKTGDVITHYAGQSVLHTMQLHDMKLREDVGRPSRVAQVLRDGQLLKVMLPSGFPGGDGFAQTRRRWGRTESGNPFGWLRSLPSLEATPPFSMGGIRLKTEAFP